MAADGGQRKRTRCPNRFKDTPVKTNNLSMAINASDQIEKADHIASILGIHPPLATLEIVTGREHGGPTGG